MTECTIEIQAKQTERVFFNLFLRETSICMSCHISYVGVMFWGYTTLLSDFCVLNGWKGLITTLCPGGLLQPLAV